MRLLCCTDTYPPQVNGVAIVTALSLNGLVARGWECALVAPAIPGDGADQRIPRTTLRSVALPIYPELRVALPAPGAVARAVREFRPDLVHCATEFLVGRMGMRAATRAGIPVVTSYHTNFARYTVAYGLGFLERPVARSIARFHRRARRTYTPSAPARDYLASIDVDTVEVWGRGVDLAQFNPSRRREELREAMGIAGRFTFLHVGRLAAEKDVGRILDAFGALRAADPSLPVSLVVAGRGPEEQALRRRAPQGVIFTGVLDRRGALPALYASCDAFVFASTTETLGLVVLEAMASGLPVVAIPAGGVADHLRHGDNGLAVPEGDTAAMAAAMRALATDAALREDLILGARLTAAERDWERELDRLDASYRQVVARG